ncbi:MAG: hypothetical protein JWQ09_1458, partial [Segetibacter sp.]|nr:hypothetical protein [Segetibacter sp.]
PSQPHQTDVRHNECCTILPFFWYGPGKRLSQYGFANSEVGEGLFQNRENAIIIVHTYSGTFSGNV